MYVQKVQRICDVAGCGNTDSYYIAKCDGIPGSIVMCKECLEETLKAIKSFEKAETRAENVKNLEEKVEKAVDEVIMPEETGFTCPDCGKEFKDYRSLSLHFRKKHGDMME